MVEVVADAEWEAMQHFVSNSPWDSSGLLRQLRDEVNQELGGTADSCLLVDESAFNKKGEASVGVARQWNGRLGKTDNCQVGVFGALASCTKVTLTDARLYLPKTWTKDTARCEKAGVPEAERHYRSKVDLALEIVSTAQEQKMDFHWVGADSFYGRDRHFRDTLAQRGLTYMVDIPANTHLYLQDPKPCVPARRAKKGRAPKRLQASTTSVQLDQWLAEQPETAFRWLTLRQGSKGALRVKVLQRLVWLWDHESPQAERVHLIVAIQGRKKQKIKYSVSNAHPDTPVERLASMQAQRYWVERALQDAKSEAGMADYQVRGWRAWHHHMAMVMLAMLFMLQIKNKHGDEYQLLTAADIRTLLQFFLPKRDITVEEVIQQLKIRHDKRKKDIDLHRKT